MFPLICSTSDRTSPYPSDPSRKLAIPTPSSLIEISSCSGAPRRASAKIVPDRGGGNAYFTALVISSVSMIPSANAVSASTRMPSCALTPNSTRPLLCVIGLRASSSPFDLRGVSVTGEAGSDDLARAGAGRLSLIQRRYGGARPLDRRRAALLRGLPGPAHGTQRLLRHG